MTVAAGTSLIVTATGAVFKASDVGSQIWQKYNPKGNNLAGRAEITSYLSPTQVTITTLTDFDDAASPTAGNWFLVPKKIYGLLNFIGETFSTQFDGAPGGNFTVASDGSITPPEATSVVQAGYGYLGMLASMNIDVGGDRGPAPDKPRKIRQVTMRLFNSGGGRVGTNKWNTRALPLKEQSQTSDRPTALYNDVVETVVSDSWSRQTKQVVILQDIPVPQTVLTVDTMIEYADD